MALSREPEGSDRSLPPQAAEMGAIPTSPRCGRHHHVSPIALVTKNPSQIKIRSDQLTYRVLLGLLDGRHYIQHPARRLAEYRQPLPKGRGYVNIALVPHSEESWEQIMVSLRMLGDELADTFLVLLAVALDINGTERITLPFAITPDDILAIRQKKKSKGSYPAHQRLTIVEQVRTLARTSVHANLILRDGKVRRVAFTSRFFGWPHEKYRNASFERQYRRSNASELSATPLLHSNAAIFCLVSKKPTSERRRVEGPLIEVLMNERPEESETCTGHTDWQQWELRIGDWATTIPELQSQTALMARQVLHYHAKKQKHEKRLGRYLTVLYRINAHRNEGRVRVSMGVLLEQACLLPTILVVD